ncbi:MAG TPA: T9SS type A sorting domain-containing protein, partial [Ginsengibacter sp.]
SVKIIQNPARGIIQLMFNNDTNKAHISLVNSASVKLLEFNQKNILQNQELDIPVNNLSGGIYFLKVATSNSIETHKIVIE